MSALLFTDPQLEIMRRAIITWGTEQQIIKAIEEMSELQKSLCKWLNLKVKVRNGQLDYATVGAQVREEIADVAIMLFQMREIFADPEFFSRIDGKLTRLTMYLPEAEAK